MSDLFLGQSMSKLYRFVTPNPAAEHTFTFDFQPDKVVFNNLTQWTSTAGGLPISIWWRDQTTAAHAFQHQVIDSAAGASFNFVDAAAAGFTVADTSGGVSNRVFNIDDVTATDPVVVSTTTAHGFQTDQIVRITDLGNVGVSNRGMAQINNLRFKIVVIDSDDFSLKDVITGEPIDGTAFTTYVSGGKVTLETNVLSLNNPQVSPYSNSNPYLSNPFSYDAVNYKLTVGTAVLKNSSTYNIEVFKFGDIEDLGTIS